LAIRLTLTGNPGGESEWRSPQLVIRQIQFYAGTTTSQTANWRPQHFSVGAAIQILFNFLSPSILLEPLLRGEGTPPNVHIGTFALLTQLYNAFWHKGMGVVRVRARWSLFRVESPLCHISKDITMQIDPGNWVTGTAFGRSALSEHYRDEDRNAGRSHMSGFKRQNTVGSARFKQQVPNFKVVTTS